MGKFAVVLGDATTHGGKVTSASSSFDISGKNAALLSDTVTGRPGQGGIANIVMHIT